MKKNMGTTDKIMRLVAAAILATLFFTHTVTGIVGSILLVVAGIFALTSLVRFCPLYLPFGINTCKPTK